MRIVRQEGKYQLLFEPLQRMYRFFDRKEDLLSFWFSENEYSDLSAEEFKKIAKKACYED